MSFGGGISIPGLCGPGLHFQLDGFRLVYLAVAVLMWGVSGIFSREYMVHYEKRRRYYRFFWATFVATAGVFLSADFYTTFVFFEIMSFTSYVWVAFDERPESLRAAETYLAVAVIGGMVMLMGLFLLENLCHTLRFDEVSQAAGRILAAETGHGEAVGAVMAGKSQAGMSGDARDLAAETVCALGSPRRQLYVAGGLLLFGFGAKAGCFPLHIWLPKAHPVAPAPASALLSGILTKAGVFGIIVVSCGMFGEDRMWGTGIACLGLITMLLGALLALFSVNLKRTLACSSVSQIGFIVTGIGMSCLLRAAGESGGLAVRGAFLHMINHSLFKLVLFLCAAAVFMNLHQLDLNEIRGFGRNKPFLMLCFLTGALGIGGMPLWSGYVSKTLLHESIVEYTQAAAAAGAGTRNTFAGSGMVTADTANRVLRGILDVTGNPAFWQAAEWIFLISGGMTVAYMLKLFVALFVDRHPDRQEEFDAMSSCYMRSASKAALALAAVPVLLFGMTAHQSLDRLADLGQTFFGLSGPAHRVDYFSFAKLKGGLISIGIGIVLYVTVVRGWMTGEKVQAAQRESLQARKVRYYRDCWPSWLDLENLLYRPVLQVALPGICGAVCGFVDRCLVSRAVTVFLAFSSVLCRAMDQLADGVIRLARESTHSQLPRVPAKSRQGTTVPGGGFVGEQKRKRREKRDLLSERVLGLEKRIRKNARLVEESFSFGLMLFAVGLCLTLGYLLLVFVRH